MAEAIKTEMELNVDLDDWFAELGSDIQPQLLVDKGICENMKQAEGFNHLGSSSGSHTPVTPSLQSPSHFGMGESLHSVRTSVNGLGESLPSIQKSPHQLIPRHQYQQYLFQQQNMEKQKPWFAAVEEQNLIGKSSNVTLQRHNNQQSPLQEKHQQQLPPYQNKFSATLPHQTLGMPNNVCGLQLKQEKPTGPRFDMLMAQAPQQPLPNLRQPINIATHPQDMQQASITTQFHQLLGFQKQNISIQENMQRQHPSSTVVLSHNQQKKSKLSNTPSVASPVSVDSTGQISGPSSFADWHDQAYCEIETMRMMYLPDVITLYKKSVELCLQPPSPELALKYKKYRTFFEKIMTIFQMTKADLFRCSKDKVYHHLSTLKQLLNSIRINSRSRKKQRQPDLQISHYGSPVTPASSLQPNNRISGSCSGSRHLHLDMLTSVQNTTQAVDPTKKSRPGSSSAVSTQNWTHQHEEHRIPTQPLQGHSGLEQKHSSQVDQKILQCNRTLLPATSSPSNNITCRSTQSSFGHSGGISPPSQNTNHDVEAQKATSTIKESIAFGDTPEIETNEDMENAMESSLKHLVQVVESMESSALISSVQDIARVMNIIDRVAVTTTVYGESILAGIGEDLAGIGDDLHGQKTYESIRPRKIKHHIDVTSGCSSSLSSLDLKGTDGFERSSHDTTDVESTATSRIKRHRTQKQLNDTLLEEICLINKRLVETVIDVVSDLFEFGKGIVVRFSYTRVAAEVDRGGDFKQHEQYSEILQVACNKAQWPMLSVELLVPADYPKSWPVLLQGTLSSIDTSETGERGKMRDKARSRFRMSLRNLEEEESMSLEVMARTWDACARAVIREWAETLGGGSFTSKYGTWEEFSCFNCLK